MEGVYEKKWDFQPRKGVYENFMNDEGGLQNFWSEGGESTKKIRDLKNFDPPPPADIKWPVPYFLEQENEWLLFVNSLLF